MHTDFFWIYLTIVIILKNTNSFNLKSKKIELNDIHDVDIKTVNSLVNNIYKSYWKIFKKQKNK